MASVTLLVPSIHCEGCAASIRRALGRLPGVEAVTVDVNARQVEVVYDPSAASLQQITERLDLAGFPVANDSATE